MAGDTLREEPPTVKMNRRQPGYHRRGMGARSPNPRSRRPDHFWLALKRVTLQARRLELTAYFLMSNPAELKRQIKRMLVENLMLQNTADEIGDDQPLFGPGGLGLDSVDALQIVVALDKNYGLKIPDPETARKIIYSVNTIAAAVEKRQSEGS
jgi:acyl carrier protein